MKVTYDPEMDVLRILFSNATLEVRDEDKPDIILDYDKNGNVVGMENPKVMEYTITESSTAVREKSSKMIHPQSRTVSNYQMILHPRCEEARFQDGYGGIGERSLQALSEGERN